MFNINKTKLQSNIFFRLISLNHSETMFNKHKFHTFREKNHSVQQLLNIPKWALTVELSQPFNDGKINTKQQFPFLIPDEKNKQTNFPCGGGCGDLVLKGGLSTRF